jgi:formylglycine-generating enzyme required for sulfatase activity
MNCLDWTEAMAFCIWDGGFLPTEAEWNYAAAGGSEQRAYPWSSPPSALTIDRSDASYCVDVSAGGCVNPALTPVGTKPAGDGRWGQSDLGGNVWEWVLDRYETPYQMPACNDCASLPVAGYQVYRGGSFSAEASNLRGAVRGDDNMSTRANYIGVRCARAQ